MVVGVGDVQGAAQRLLSSPPPPSPRGTARGAVRRRNSLVTGAAASRRPPPPHKWLSGIGSQFASGAGSRLSDHGSRHGSFLGARGEQPTPVPRTFPVPRWSCLIAVAESGICSPFLSVAAHSSPSFSPLQFHVRSVIGRRPFQTNCLLFLRV